MAIIQLVNKNQKQAQKKEVYMKYQIPFYLDLVKEKIHVTIEVECSDEPKFSAGRLFFVIRPVSHYDVLTDKSSKGWEHYFTVSPSYDDGMVIYTDDDCHYFYMGLAEKE